MVFEFVLRDVQGNAAPGLAVTVSDRNNGLSFTGYSDGNGYVNVNAEPDPAFEHFSAGDLLVLAVNGQAILSSSTGDPRGPVYYVATSEPLQRLTLVVQPFKNPANWTVDQLCAVRGGMWTARLNVGYGPRPGHPSNINALDYLEVYPQSERARMLHAYGKGGNGYTHCVDGPMLDAGYHGQYPAVDYREDPGDYFAAMQEKWNAAICPIHFAYPDLYGFGDDALDRFMRDFEPIYRSAEAQRLIRMWVPYGWERGYEVTSAQWVRLLTWARDVLPNALVGIHLRADQDAPTGGNDDKIPGWTNGKAWEAVAPYTHLWFVQNGGYVNGGTPVPDAMFVRNFTDQFRVSVTGSLAHRFDTGYAGWPQWSAFGTDQPIRLVAGEFASFADYWWDWPESEAKALGDAAIAAGALGSLDGCTMVPR
jgi:hypothetical protein